MSEREPGWYWVRSERDVLIRRLAEAEATIATYPKTVAEMDEMEMAAFKRGQASIEHYPDASPAIRAHVEHARAEGRREGEIAMRERAEGLCRNHCGAWIDQALGHERQDDEEAGQRCREHAHICAELADKLAALPLTPDGGK